MPESRKPRSVGGVNVPKATGATGGCGLGREIL